MIQRFSNRRYISESTESNIVLGRTIKTLQPPLNLFFYLLFQINYANYRVDRQSTWIR